MRICFVCWGNICRSPTAAAVMDALVEDAGLTGRIAVDSAGTSAEHTGDPPDRRARAEAERRGLRLDHRAWQFGPADFERFDLVVAADDVNARRLRRLAGSPAQQEKIRLLREFDPGAGPGDLDVPDPYYGGPDGFARVYEVVEASCRGLLDHVRDMDGW